MSDSINLTDIRRSCNILVLIFRYLEMIPSSRPQFVCLPCFSQSVEFLALQFQQWIFGKFEWEFLEKSYSWIFALLQFIVKSIYSATSWKYTAWSTVIEMLVCSTCKSVPFIFSKLNICGKTSNIELLFDRNTFIVIDHVVSLFNYCSIFGCISKASFEWHWPKDDRLQRQWKFQFSNSAQKNQFGSRTLAQISCKYYLILHNKKMRLWLWTEYSSL